MKLKYLSHPGMITCVALITLSIIAHFFNRKPTLPKNYLAYRQYITAFTAGEISRKSPIIVRFVDEMVRPGEVNKDLGNNPFSFQPYLYGDCRWIDSRTLQFTPNWLLESDQVYNANLALDEITSEIPDSLSNFNFQFRTPKQFYQVNISNPVTIDNNSPQWQRIEGTFSCTDYEKNDRIENLISAFHDGNQLKLKWKHDNDEHNFTVDSLLRTNESSEVIFKWSNEGRREITITSLGNFSHINTSTQSYPNQCITLEFSDPIKKGQILEGLIRIGNTDSKFSVEGNKIHLFPQKRLAGNHEVIIEKAIQNFQGHTLKSRTSSTVSFTEIFPEIRSVGKGTILPSSNIIPFVFEAVNLSAIDVRIIKITEKNIPQFLQVNNLDGSRELKRVGNVLVNKKIALGKNKDTDLKNWNRHVLDLSKLIQTEPGAIYEVSIGFRKSYSLYPCSDTTGGDSQPMLGISPSWEDPDEYYYDDDYLAYDYYLEDEDYNDREDPCKKSYYNPRRSISRNILASNLGLIAKRGSEGSMFITVTDLLSTSPISDATVEIYNYQQQLIGQGKTKGNGTANIKLNKKPFLVIAKSGKQRGYLKTDEGSSLSLSRFDITGKEYHKGMKGFIYGERDVWRPGDSIYLNFIMEDKLESFPLNHPVVMELYNPKQELVKRMTKTSSLNHLYSFHTKTEDDAVTGNYVVKIQAGGASFEKTIKVETIIANRLKLKLDWIQNDTLEKNRKMEGLLSVRWLHGAPAQNLNSDVSVTLTQTPSRFKNYPEYIFDDISKKFQSETKSIFKGQLDTKGNAKIYATINTDEEAPGTLKVVFKTKVFEPGGNFSTDYFSVPFHPYQIYAGLKVPESKSANSTLETDKDHKIKIVLVDLNGKPISGKKLVVELYKISWRWWWDTSNEEDFNYNGKIDSESVKSDTLTTINGGAIWNLKVKAPDWGRYFIRVTAEGGHSTGKIIYLDWPGWRGRGEEDNPEGAKMLVFSSDKEIYSVGENITLNIPTGFSGRALLSLESGTKVIGSYWIEANKGTTQFKFPATKNMAPNVYAHISLLQPHAQTRNDLPMRMYGVLPLKVEDETSHLYPVIDIANELKPEKSESISISEKSGKPMTYTIAIVDEGILDLTRYHTPDIWAHFNERQALDVKTWDMFDEVAGADASKIKNLLSIGGDGNRGPLEGAKANRFKPVVIFMGPFHINSEEKRIHHFKLPNYVGSVRVMVIAGYNGTYGNSEKPVQVKKPLMVLGTLPRILSPNENFNFPVTLFAMEKNIKNISLQLQINDLLLCEGNKNKQVNSPETGEQIVCFPLRVSKQTGIAKVKVTANSGKEIAIYETEVEIRNPNPQITNVKNGIIESGRIQKNEFAPAGMKGTNCATIEISSIPPINLGSRLEYLIKYPYGCVEQTTSSVFPQLHLSKLMNLTKENKAKVDRNIRAGIARLKNFQLQDGGLSYWPGGYAVNDWGTCYAGHFMLEAEMTGYSLPYGFKENWIKYQKNRARNDDGEDELTRAYRLYLLSLAKATELGAMNRMRSERIKSIPAAWYLAAAYYLSGQPETAQIISEKLPIEVKDYHELSNTFGSGYRDKAIILQSLTILRNKDKASIIMKDLSKTLNTEEYLNTQETAYILVAIAKFTGVDTPSELNFSYRLKDGKWKKIKSTSPVWQYSYPNNEKEIIEIENHGNKILFTKIITKGIPDEGDKTNAAHNLSLNIVYKTMDGKTIDPSLIMQGTDFMAEVIVINPATKKDYEQLSLTQIFPSGWEIHNSRINGSGSPYGSNIPTFQDFRDDRVNTFYDLKMGESKKFIILLNASYEGRFYLPTIYAEAMYDNSINARKHGMWVEVRSNKNLIQ